MDKVRRWLRGVPLPRPVLIVVVGLFAVAGIMLLVRSHAASPTLGSEPEGGTASAPAVVINDSTASGGKAVKFGAPAPTPSPSPSPSPTPTPSPPGCQVSATLVNSCGPWLGAFAKDYPQVAVGLKNQILYHEQRIGRQVSLVKDYKNGGSGLGADDTYFINRPNTYLVATWKPGSNFGSADGGDATVNGYIDTMANSIKAVAPHKVFLSLWHEPENDVSAGTSACSAAKGNAGSPAQYRAMWSNVRTRFNNKGVTNVVWTWIPMGYSGWFCMDKDLYPGNSLVDWIMWDPYGQSDKSTWNGQIGSFYNWMTSNTDATHAFTSKAWGIAETSTHLSSQASSSAYWNEAKSALDAGTFSRIKAYIVFDSNAGKQDNRIMYWCDPATAGTVINNQSTCGHDIIDNNEQNAYKAFANDSHFVK